MNHTDKAKDIVGKLLGKKADITKEVPAMGSGKDLFGNEITPEPASEVSDKDLFGQTKEVDAADREAADLPPEVKNSDENSDTSDTEKLDQGYSTSSDKTDDVYTGSGDGPKL
mgnify:CR=1 FL=1|tara:strand:+ start:1052 stop:1390 length:339 start_codon:yes stop_codon:yes gene_type:complete